MRKFYVAFLACVFAPVLVGHALAEDGPAGLIEKANISGGLVGQVGSDGTMSADALKDLGDTFHVRVLTRDQAEATLEKARFQKNGLQGKFTCDVFKGNRLPFNDEVLNALVIVDAGTTAASEFMRVLAPRGLLIEKKNGTWTATPKNMPPEYDAWTHYLYDASGNAVSKDRKVGPPRSFRWTAGPLHLRSHDWVSSVLDMVTAHGRVFYILDEGPSHLLNVRERWALVARDAFNGALLWKRPLAGYGYNFFEQNDPGRPNAGAVWRSPLSLNRRLVAAGDKLVASLCYRNGPLSILDAVTGKTLHELDLGGSVDEIIVDGDLAIVRVRGEIPETHGIEKPRWPGDRQKYQVLLDRVKPRYYGYLTNQKTEKIAAIDIASGKQAWEHETKPVAHQMLAALGDRVCYHDYESLVALDKATGKTVWKAKPDEPNKRLVGVRGLFGNLLMKDGKVLFSSSSWGGGGGRCYDVSDGTLLWHNKKMGTTGGFTFPTGMRVIKNTVWYDNTYSPICDFETGEDARNRFPDIGGMLKRGHHTRCFAGKATEHYLITPQRGAEFIDLEGDNYMVNDWLRGACSYGVMPAYGMLYTTPDPCVCYSGVKINGFHALAPDRPDPDRALPPDSPKRLEKGPAWDSSQKSEVSSRKGAWPTYRRDAKRSARASAPVPADLKRLWNVPLNGDLTPLTIADGKVFVVLKDKYELYCLDLNDGSVLWRVPFGGLLDGPPTIVGNRAYIGCGDGYVYCLDIAGGRLAWRFLAAPFQRLSLDDDALSSTWPVRSAVLYQNGQIIVEAGRSSYLDGGIHLYALEPATGKVIAHEKMEGPYPTMEQMKQPVIFKGGRKGSKGADQYVTGYDMEGASPDILVGDGKNIYMRQSMFDENLENIPTQRSSGYGVRPLGERHLMANTGFLEDSFFHRTFWMYEDIWPGKSGGSGTAAHAGTLVVLGEEGSYAAQHYTGGWYPKHRNGEGNTLLHDTYETRSRPIYDVEKPLKGYGANDDITRTALPKWKINIPIIVRAMLIAPGKDGGDGTLFVAGVVEGKTQEEWNRAAEWKSPAKLLVFNAGDGAQQAEYDLPACPVFDGMAAADGQLIVAMKGGRLTCLGQPPPNQSHSPAKAGAKP